MILTKEGGAVYDRATAREALGCLIDTTDFEVFMGLAYVEEVEEAIYSHDNPKVLELEMCVDHYGSMGNEVYNMCDELLSSKERITARDFAKRIKRIINEYM